jgi:hypothetical protein
LNMQLRLAQNSYMLCKSHLTSLTSDTKKKANQYCVGDDKMSSGVAMLKVIIRESHLDAYKHDHKSDQNQALKFGYVYHDD